jgi:hypothetical protein
MSLDGAASQTGQSTDTTAHQGPQEIGVRRVIASSELPVRGQFGLHPVKDVLTHQRWNMRHKCPLLWPRCFALRDWSPMGPPFNGVRYRDDHCSHGLKGQAGRFFLTVCGVRRGCISISWHSSGKPGTRLPVGLPRLVEKNTAQGEQGVEVRDIPAHPRPFDPRSGDLFSGTLNRA